MTPGRTNRVPTNRTGKVYLVGAGPGDPELLTLKGRRLIGSADVVVYDALVNAALIRLVRPGAVAIRAGKRGGAPSTSQAEINRLLVEHASRGRIVVRLKGGDPFVFGRGAEEIEALARHAIPWEVVPGVSAGLAGPASAGIPLTHRSSSASVAFVTATEASSGAASKVDWTGLAAAVDTLVVFMCAAALEQLGTDLVAAGRSAATPVAIISNATLSTQSVLHTTIGEIAVRPPDVPRPALAVVGELAAFPLMLALEVLQKEVGYEQFVA